MTDIPAPPRKRGRPLGGGNPRPPKPSPADVLALQATIPSRRILSILTLSQLLDIDRSVIERWVQKSECPVVRQGSKGVGYEIDISQVFKWRIEFERRTVMAEFGKEGEDDKMSERMAMLKLGERAGLVAPVADMEGLFESAYAEFKMTMMGLSTLIGRSMAGFPPDQVRTWRHKCDDYVREALNALIESAAGKVRPPPVTILENES